MAKVLILSLVFPPDNVSTAQLMGELSIDLRRAGHNVSVITTTPHYNPPRPGAGRASVQRWLWPIVTRSHFHQIPVYHVWVPRKGRNLLLRLFGWAFFHAVGTLLGWLIPFRGDVVLAPSPPLTIGLSAWLIGLVRRSRFIYNIQELYPDVAVHLGFIKSPWLIRVLHRLESFVYQRATALTTISEGMRQCVIGKGVPAEKVTLIPNFVDVGTFGRCPRDNEFSRSHDLLGKFVISYAGNMGRPQSLDIFVRAFGALGDLPSVHLLMVGSGSEYEPLRALSAKLQLSNITFLPQQPYSSMPLIYACSHLSIVSQSVGTHADGIPSKVYRIMGSARAVLAYTRPDSDLSVLIRRADAGMVVSSHDVEVVATSLRAAAESPERWVRCGEKAREYVENHYGRESVSAQYATLISQIHSGLSPSENRRS